MHDYHCALLNGWNGGLASNGVCVSAASAAGLSAWWPSDHGASAKEVIPEWQVDMSKCQNNVHKEEPAVSKNPFTARRQRRAQKHLGYAMHRNTRTRAGHLQIIIWRQQTKSMYTAAPKKAMTG